MLDHLWAWMVGGTLWSGKSNTECMQNWKIFCHILGLIVSRTFGLYVMWRRDFSSPRPKLQRRAIFWVHTPGPSTTTLERVLQPGWSWHKIVLELQNHLRHVISGLFDQFDPARLRSSLGVCLLRCSLRSHGKEVSDKVKMPSKEKNLNISCLCLYSLTFNPLFQPI